MGENLLEKSEGVEEAELKSLLKGSRQRAAGNKGFKFSIVYHTAAVQALFALPETKASNFPLDISYCCGAGFV